MFYNNNATDLTFNCDVKPNTDVSGIGARGAIYVQAILSILTLMFGISPDDVLLTTLSVQMTAGALIVSGYLDTSIDVPHTIIASQLAVLLSACRITSYDIPDDDDAHSPKALSRLWLLDLFCRPVLLAFNMQIWASIRYLQQHPSQCPDGFGRWTFFSKVDLRTASTSTMVAFVYCILDIVWEAGRYAAEWRRIWHLAKQNQQTRYASIPQNAQRNDRRCYSAAQNQQARQTKVPTETLHKDPRFEMSVLALNCPKLPESWTFKASLAFKVLLTVYTITVVESTISDNNLDTGEDVWTFGQVFALMNMCSMLAATVTAFWNRYHVWISSHLVRSILITVYFGVLCLAIPTYLVPMARAWRAQDPGMTFAGSIMSAGLFGLVIICPIGVMIIWFFGVFMWSRRQHWMARYIIPFLLPICSAFGFEGPFEMQPAAADSYNNSTELASVSEQENHRA